MAALEWSEKHFGEEAALRYHQLLRTAFIEIGNDLEAPGSKFVDDFRLLHLQNSRKKTPVRGLILKLPRHFLFDREREGGVEIVCKSSCI